MGEQGNKQIDFRGTREQVHPLGASESIDITLSYTCIFFSRLRYQSRHKITPFSIPGQRSACADLGPFFIRWVQEDYTKIMDALNGPWMCSSVDRCTYNGFDPSYQRGKRMWPTRMWNQNKKKRQKQVVCLPWANKSGIRSNSASFAVKLYLNPMVHNNCKNGQVQYSAAYKLGWVHRLLAYMGGFLTKQDYSSYDIVYIFLPSRNMRLNISLRKWRVVLLL